MKLSFADNVRVRSTLLTEERGLAGLVGQVYGETKPSVTSIEVIGELQTDYAINVHFKDLDTGYWFASELLEFVDHAPGTEVTLRPERKKWVRAASGEWISQTTESPKKPWLKFW